MRDPRTRSNDYDRQSDVGDLTEAMALTFLRSRGNHAWSLPGDHYVDIGLPRKVGRPDLGTWHPWDGSTFVEVKYEASLSYDLFDGGGPQFSVEARRVKDHVLYGAHFGVPVFLLLVVESGVPPEADLVRAKKYGKPPPPDEYPSGVFAAPVEHLAALHRGEPSQAGEWWWFNATQFAPLATFEEFRCAATRWPDDASHPDTAGVRAAS